jgi:predicted phosphodiesterase
MFQLVSDLHLELYSPEFEINLNDILTVSAPYLILAGDIGNPYQKIYDTFLNQCSKVFKKIFMVSGNHEYYQAPVKNNITMVNSQIKSVVDKYDNIFFLNNDIHKIILDDQDKILDQEKINKNIDKNIDKNIECIIIGTTLWSYVSSSLSKTIEVSINDYYKIYGDNMQLITTKTTNLMHVKNVKWLTDTISKYSNKNIIIISHHLPSYQLISDAYKGSEINSAFASDLDYLMNNDNVKYFCSGHTHYSFDKIINKTRCLVNPRGYPKKNSNKKSIIKSDNREYKKDLTFSI